jgi:hypothetical protein
MRQEAHRVHRRGVALGPLVVLGPRVPGPRDSEVKCLGRNVLDEGKEVDEVGLLIGSERRQAETAIGDDHGGAAMRRHRVAIGIPPHGGVVVGVRLNEPGDYIGPRRVDLCLGLPAQVGSDLNDATGGCAHVGSDRGLARAVDDDSAPDQEAPPRLCCLRHSRSPSHSRRRTSRGADPSQSERSI